MDFEDFQESSNIRNKRRTEQMKKLRAKSINEAFEIDDNSEEEVPCYFGTFGKKKFEEEDEKVTEKKELKAEEFEEETNVVVSDLEMADSVEEIEEIHEIEDKSKNDSFIPMFNKLKSKLATKDNLTTSYMMALGLTEDENKNQHFHLPSTNDTINEELSIYEESLISRDSNRVSSRASPFPSFKRIQSSPKTMVFSNMLSKGINVSRSHAFQKHVYMFRTFDNKRKSRRNKQEAIFCSITEL